MKTFYYSAIRDQNWDSDILKIGRFTKQDIRELCPSLGVSSIEGALCKMVASGKLKREGSGKTPAISGSSSSSAMALFSRL